MLVLGHDRDGRREFLMLANFSDDTVDREVAEPLELVHCGGGARFEDGSVHLPPLSYVWLAGVRVAGVRVAGVRVAGVRMAEWHASSSDRL